MTKMTFGIITFVAGAAVSAVATYFITRKIERTRAEIYIQRQLDEDRKALKSRETKTVEEIKEDAVEEYCEQVRADRAEHRKLAGMYNTTNPNRFKGFDPDSEEVKSALEKSRVDSDNPFLITEEELGEEGYDVQNLFFHPDAGDVADAYGILVDPEETVGSKLFNSFVADDDVDEIFVRNPFLMIDFWLQKEFLK